MLSRENQEEDWTSSRFPSHQEREGKRGYSSGKGWIPNLFEALTPECLPRTLSASLRLCAGLSAAVVGMTQLILFLWLFSADLWAQLPDGPGREETERLCQSCHDLARSVSRRQDRDGWQATLNKMVAFGTRGTDREFALILDYLAKHFPAQKLLPVNVNKAAAIELESRLSLRRSQAAAIIAYRAKHGKFKSIEDLKQVPGVDAEKIEAKKDGIAF